MLINLTYQSYLLLPMATRLDLEYMNIVGVIVLVLRIKAKGRACNLPKVFYMNKLQTPLKDLKLGELRKYLFWADDEIREWKEFKKQIEKEYEKRIKTK